MCGIFASFDANKFRELGQQNLYRGTKSSSVTHLRSDDGNVTIESMAKSTQKLYSDMFIDPSMTLYKVGHNQAPTSGSSNIHPAFVKDDNYLWHNGLLKDFEVKRLQGLYNAYWDTELLLNHIIYSDGWTGLNDINGSFACIMLSSSTLFIFRNDIAPLFVDNSLNVSSVKFEGAEELPPNKVYMFDFSDIGLWEIDSFTTKENPYYFPVGD